jgi:exosortase A
MNIRWRNHLMLLAVVVAIMVALFFRDWKDMALLWWDVSTYNHCLFILPIVGWLIWQRKGELARLTPRAWWPGLIGVGAGALLWMLGEAGGIAFFRHIAVVLMVQGAAVTLLGRAVGLGLMFPLFYLFFLIPFGDEAVSLLQTITAKLSMFFLGLAGVPAHIDGIFITTPSGLFQVAEACSGVKFLVAMAAYATLVANVCFISWKRRFIFLLFSGIVPIIANGLRAFGTIYASELTGNTDFASSFDHIIFGWVFFAVVIAIVMLVAWRWFDRSIDAPWIADVEDEAPAPSSVLPKAGAVLALVMGSLILQASLATMGRVSLPSAISLPQPNGWSRANSSSAVGWAPRFKGAEHQLRATFRRSDGAEADFAVALFGWQEEGKEIVGFGQGAVDPDGPWHWSENQPNMGAGRVVRLKADDLPRDVAIFYWIGGILTGSETRVKLETLKARMLGQQQAAVAILVSSQGNAQITARTAIEGLVGALGPLDGVAVTLVDQARTKR